MPKDFTKKNPQKLVLPNPVYLKREALANLQGPLLCVVAMGSQITLA
jgi:hypothetical protein